MVATHQEMIKLDRAMWVVVAIALGAEYPN
jgi:hypothetical protein